MQLDIVRTSQGMADLSGEWNQLLQNSASDVPFLRHEYMSAWWENLGGGEWEQGDLCILTARSSDRRLTGIAPFFFTTNQEGTRALMFLGSHEISDYLDFIARPEDLPDFLEVVCSWLSSADAPPWQVMDLYNILETSPTIERLKEHSSQCSWKFSIEKLQPSPYIPLPGDWETYLGGIDKKQRHEIRRKLRRVEAGDDPVSWYMTNGLEDPDALESEIEAFFNLMSQDEEKKSFLTSSMRRQMRAIVHTAARAGWLQLAFLTVNDQKIAGYLNFDYRNHIWVYNSGLDFSYRELSPGWVLLAYLLRWANENGRAAFDFMRGNETYKYRFGGVDRFVVKARIER